MEATVKAHPIDEFLTAMTGVSRPEAVRSGYCVSCKGDAVYFKDDLSRKEFTISGLCQGCQNKVFC